MLCLTLLVISFVTFWISQLAIEDIYQIVLILVSLTCLIWGLFISPIPVILIASMYLLSQTKEKESIPIWQKDRT